MYRYLGKVTALALLTVNVLVVVLGYCILLIKLVTSGIVQATDQDGESTWQSKAPVLKYLGR